MIAKHRRLSVPVAITAALTLAVAGCGADTDTAADEATAGSTTEVEDNHGTKSVPTQPTSVVASDNRTFVTLDSWGGELSAGAKSLMPDNVSYTDYELIVDLGSHPEHALETV